LIVIPRLFIFIALTAWAVTFLGMLVNLRRVALPTAGASGSFP
jgi:hypothetical protein